MTGVVELAFLFAGLNPLGGMFIAIPLAIYTLHYPAWLAVVLAVPLAYAQVVFVDLGWSRLSRWSWFVRYVESRRSPALERRLCSRWSRLWIAIVGPWMGPWLVMAICRYARLRQREIAPALLAGITYMAVLTALVSWYAPNLLPTAAGGIAP
ncbi:MAG: hypothetical protein HYV63_18490 [Candidatus Schekmanbacteria bacterium]|nr:hypothetical protein [Candidatus Schekmanbacteria bacterium]